MSHEVEGRVAFSGEVPWHSLGIPIPAGTSVHDAMRIAKMDWTVTKKRLTLPFPDGRETDSYAILREKDSRILGYTGPDYVPVQNADAFLHFQKLIDAKVANIECVGSLRGGEDVFLLARIGDWVDITKDDPVGRFLMLHNNHSGRASESLRTTHIRAVCANTLNAARRGHDGFIRYTRHVGDTRNKTHRMFIDAEKCLKEFEEVEQKYRIIAAHRIEMEEAREYFRCLNGESAEEKDSKPTRAMMENFVFGRGSYITEPSLWRAYNAVTEYYAHEYLPNADRRYSSLWLGNSGDRVNKALDLAYNTAVAPLG